MKKLLGILCIMVLAGCANNHPYLFKPPPPKPREAHEIVVWSYYEQLEVYLAQDGTVRWRKTQ
jgi:hypothetical protein